MADRLLYVAVVLSVVGLLSLVFVSNFLDVPYSRVGDVDSSYIERSVHLRGSVDSVHAFKGGSLLITLVEDDSSVDVYVPYSVAVGLNSTALEGSSMDVVGLVQLYEGKIEVAVEKAEDLVVE